MVRSLLFHVSASPTTLPFSLVTLPSSSVSLLPCLPAKSHKKYSQIRASSANTDHSQPDPFQDKNDPIAVLLNVPRTIWKRTLRPLSDFGFGRRSIWEGGVGLFIASGALLLALTLAWFRGFQLRSRFRKYQVVFEFSQASGISTGTAVRIRGVTVGNVIRVNPSLRNIEAVVEVSQFPFLFI